MTLIKVDIEGILPKGPYPPCLRMADKALLAGHPWYAVIADMLHVDIRMPLIIKWEPDLGSHA